MVHSEFSLEPVPSFFDLSRLRLYVKECTAGPQICRRQANLVSRGVQKAHHQCINPRGYPSASSDQLCVSVRGPTRTYTCTYMRVRGAWDIRTPYVGVSKLGMPQCCWPSALHEGPLRNLCITFNGRTSLCGPVQPASSPIRGCGHQRYSGVRTGDIPRPIKHLTVQTFILDQTDCFVLRRSE